jgi:diguanylate cyclase (GGDEF)-like protein/PAS domain S-box-containing protein
MANESDIGATRRPRREDRSPRFFSRFVVLSLLVFLGAGAGLHYLLTWRVRADQRSVFQDRAVGLVDTAVRGVFGAEDLTAPLRGERYEELRRKLSEDEVHGALRIKVWRVDGTVVFSDSPGQVGTRIGQLAPLLKRVLEGGPRSAMVDGDDPAGSAEAVLASRVLRTYVPLPLAPGSRAPGAVADVYQDFGPGSAAETKTLRTIEISVLSALLLLYGAVLSISHFLDRGLRREAGRLTDEAAAIQRSEERFRSLVQNTSDIITITESDTTIRYQSPAVQRVLGYRPDEMVGKKLADLIHPEDAPRVVAYHAAVTNHPGSRNGLVEARWRHRDGSWRYVETIRTNLLSNASVRGVVLNSRDITDRKVLQAQLTHQAFHDPLTHLANRALFRETVEKSLVVGGRRNQRLALLFLDLDNFKNINDSLGHNAGDRLLCVIAERLEKCLRPRDTAARLGGDEFALLIENVTDLSIATHVAERVIDALRTPLTLDSKEVFVTTSVGIALSEVGDNDADALLRDADVAMYMAKSSGKGRYAIFEPGMRSGTLERLQLAADLQRAIEHEEFVVLYQPTVELSTGRIVGVEALVRWDHPERGLLLPEVFIPLAEETGLIQPLGRWVLEHACRQTQRWHADHVGEPSLAVAVNLSAPQLQQAGIVDEVMRAVRESRLDPRTLIIEITESVLMDNVEATIARLSELRKLGIRLAIDDFGTGYSSLDHLRRFPIDILKMDRSFVSGIGNGPEDDAFARAIINLGRTLRLEIIAEGIEEHEQLACLREMGCDLGQGFLFAQPLTADAVATLLRDSSLAGSRVGMPQPVVAGS